MSPIEKAIRDMFENAKKEAVEAFNEKNREQMQEAEEEVKAIKDEIKEVIAYGTEFEEEAERYVAAIKNRDEFDRDLRRLKNHFEEVEKYLFPSKNGDKEEV